MSGPVQAGDVVCFADAEARHIRRVLRHQTGDRVFATDGRGSEYEVELTEVTPAVVRAVVRSVRQRPREPRCRLTLAPAVLKGDGLASVVDGAVQLGVERIVPVRTVRTVGRLSATKLARLRSVAIGAVKSSAGSWLPVIEQPASLSEVAASAGLFDCVLVAYERETSRTLADALQADATEVLLFIGPEGGFDEREIRELAAAGARCFTLGPRRLRAETAGVVAASAVLQVTEVSRHDSARKEVVSSDGGYYRA